jgi:hypothetical protein
MIYGSSGKGITIFFHQCFDPDRKPSKTLKVLIEVFEIKEFFCSGFKTAWYQHSVCRLSDYCPVRGGHLLTPRFKTLFPPLA